MKNFKALENRISEFLEELKEAYNEEVVLKETISREELIEEIKTETGTVIRYTASGESEGKDVEVFLIKRNGDILFYNNTWVECRGEEEVWDEEEPQTEEIIKEIQDSNTIGAVIVKYYYDRDESFITYYKIED